MVEVETGEDVVMGRGVGGEGVRAGGALVESVNAITIDIVNTIVNAIVIVNTAIIVINIVIMRHAM
jgi:hypothetical protein